MKDPITKESIIERSPDMLSSAIDDEVVLLSITNSKYYGMDDIGTEIWDLLEKTTKVEKIIEIVLQKYKSDNEEIEKDILEYLQDLHKNNIIQLK